MGIGEGRGEVGVTTAYGEYDAMMTGLCVCCAKQACFVKYIIDDSVAVVVVAVMATMAGGRWWLW